MGCLVYKTQVNVINVYNGDFVLCSPKVGKKSGKENIHTENGINYLTVEKVTDASLMTEY